MSSPWTAWIPGLGPDLGRPDLGRIVFTASPERLAAVAVGAVAVLVLSWMSARGKGGRILQWVLLLPAVLALAWALAEPVAVRQGGHREPGRFAILVDDSRSMSVEDGDPTRAEQARERLRRLRDATDPDVPAEVYRFGADLALGDTLYFSQPDTDVGQALTALSERYAGERLAGIALVTDGLDRGGLRLGSPAEAELPDLDLPGPLTVYGVGHGDRLLDLAVQDVASGGFAFIRAPFELAATVEGTGLAPQELEVTLTRDGSLVDRKPVTLDDEGRGEVSFEVVPTRVGRFAYEVSVPVPPGDVVPGNNTLSVVVRVVRDRLRVLQVCGAPSADQKFLRLFLKQDPAVDLVSFFIMRTEEDMRAGYASSELSLIPFPYEQLFTRDLWSFDLVFFQNFDYAPYFGWAGTRLLQNVATWVREGGGFAMIGGDRSFDLGGYAGTPIADILPVQLGVQGDPVDLATFSPVLTEAGRRHPLTTISQDPEENRATWDRLAPLDGINLSRGPTEEAAVLLSHPDRTGPEGEPLPVVAVRAVGDGRSMAFLGDSSWKWSFTEAGRGRGNQAYLRFWKQAMRWLVGDPESRRVRVDTPVENYRVGEEVRIRVRVRDVGFQPMEGVAVRGWVEGPSFPGIESGQEPELPPAADAEGDPVRAGTFTAITGPAGEAEGVLEVTEPGAHRVHVQALDGQGRPFYEAGTVFAVSTRDPELEEVAPDLAFLERLARRQEGAWHPPGQWEPPLLDPSAGRFVEEDETTPLWNLPLVALVVGVFASLSWWVRRRAGAR